ncbi:hypothetical protein LXL04_027342 [Taraxacum kok-saghyz]
MENVYSRVQIKQNDFAKRDDTNLTTHLTVKVEFSLSITAHYRLLAHLSFLISKLTAYLGLDGSNENNYWVHNVYTHVHNGTRVKPTFILKSIFPPNDPNFQFPILFKINFMWFMYDLPSRRQIIRYRPSRDRIHRDAVQLSNTSLRKASKTAQVAAHGACEIHMGRVQWSTGEIWSTRPWVKSMPKSTRGVCSLLYPSREISHFLHFSTDCSEILSRASSSSHMRIPIFKFTCNPPINVQIKVSQQQTRKTEKMLKMHVFIRKCNAITETYKTMHIPPQAEKLASSSMLGEWHQSSLIVLEANGPVLEPVGFEGGEALIERMEIRVVRIKALAIGVDPFIHGGIIAGLEVIHVRVMVRGGRCISTRVLWWGLVIFVLGIIGRRMDSVAEEPVGIFNGVGKGNDVLILLVYEQLRSVVRPHEPGNTIIHFATLKVVKVCWKNVYGVAIHDHSDNTAAHNGTRSVPTDNREFVAKPRTEVRSPVRWMGHAVEEFQLPGRQGE